MVPQHAGSFQTGDKEKSKNCGLHIGQENPARTEPPARPEKEQAFLEEGVSSGVWKLLRCQVAYCISAARQWVGVLIVWNSSSRVAMVVAACVEWILGNGISTERQLPEFHSRNSSSFIEIFPHCCIFTISTAHF